MNQVFSGWQAWHAQHNQVRSQALAENLKRLPWLFMAIIGLYVVGAWVGWLEQAQTDAAYAAFARLYTWMDVVTVAGSLLLLLVLQADLSRQSLLRRWMPEGVVAYFLLFGVVITALAPDTQRSATMYVLSCMGCSGLLLVRPAVSGCMYALSLGLFAMAMRGLGAEPRDFLALELLYGCDAAVMGWVVSLVLWRWFTAAELLRRKVDQQRADLADRNAELARQQELLQDLVQHDSLTGLLNRRAFTQQAQLLCQRAARDGSTLAVVMLDLDFFKRVNDHYGHPAGDAVIIHMADVIRASVRDTDLAARVGGEEFMLVLPHSSADNAGVVAEKIRHQLAQAPLVLPSGQPVSMTVSAGVVACQPMDAAHFEALYSASDRALYEAKQSGRNCVKVVTIL